MLDFLKRSLREELQDPNKQEINTAASGRFSSDRTIAEYNSEIWKLRPLHPKLPDKPGS